MVKSELPLSMQWAVGWWSARLNAASRLGTVKVRLEPRRQKRAPSEVLTLGALRSEGPAPFAFTAALLCELLCKR